MDVLTKEERALLSKHKYIYCVYRAGGTLHAERFPVIYINASYVYIKRDRNEELQRISVGNVKNDIWGCDLDRGAWSGFSYREPAYVWWIWNMANDFELAKAEFLKEQERKKMEAYKQKVTNDYRQAAKEYEDCKKAYMEVFGEESGLW